jgi:hypothetical protein
VGLLKYFQRRNDGRCEPVPPLSNAASLLGKAGAKARKDRCRAKVIAKCNEMRAAMGMEPI